MTTLIFLPETGVAKRRLIERAYALIGMSGRIFERSPEQTGEALAVLNDMMREWPWDQLGFTLPSYGEGLPEELSNIPDHAVSAVQYELAKRLAPEYGKTLSPAFMAASARAMAKLHGNVASIPVLKPKYDMPRGQGYRDHDGVYRPFFNEDVSAEEEDTTVVTPDPGDLAGIAGGN